MREPSPSTALRKDTPTGVRVCVCARDGETWIEFVRIVRWKMIDRWERFVPRNRARVKSLREHARVGHFRGTFVFSGATGTVI